MKWYQYMFMQQPTNMKFNLVVEKRLSLISLSVIAAMLLITGCATNDNSSLTEPTLTNRPPLEASPDNHQTPTHELDRVKKLASTSLSSQLEIREISLTPIGIELIDWPDASLGCPKPGYLYAQVITPGYRITFDLNGVIHKIHSTLDGTHMVNC